MKFSFSSKSFKNARRQSRCRMHPEAARALRRTCLPACSLLVSSVPCSLHASLTASPQAEHHHSHCRILIVRCPFDTHQIKIFDREETAVWAHIPSETASSYAMKLCWVVCVCHVSCECVMWHVLRVVLPQTSLRYTHKVPLGSNQRRITLDTNLAS